jgi:hypothetical protein
MEASRKHGPFDTRWPSASFAIESSAAAPTAPPRRAEEAAVALDWEAFCNRYFPGRGRHKMEALGAYATHAQGRESLEPEEAGPRRLPAAMAAKQL